MTGISEVSRKLSYGFSAGAVGGIINEFIAIIFGGIGLLDLLGVNLQPEFDKFDLYQKIVWGGLWGFIFLLPIFQDIKQKWLKASLFGLGPSLTQIFVVFPLSTPFGVGGVGLGALTPFLVVVFNTIGWSIPAYYIYSHVLKEEEIGLSK